MKISKLESGNPMQSYGGKSDNQNFLGDDVTFRISDVSIECKRNGSQGIPLSPHLPKYPWRG
ncbi:MAG: hypothetical protein HDR48_00370 [Bacteroides sp.]|nr:hypothetical protein [Bacteroides sp.]